MSGLALKIADVATILLTSAWFRTIVLIVAAAMILVAVYRRLKLDALEKIVYSREFSTDGRFVGETIELTEEIRNPTYLPLFAVKIEFFMPSGLTVDGVACNEYTRLTSIFNIPPF